ncbi:MAG: sigma-70 family RNA polymerase sigma factor [Acidobacteria bacterium]|nr:sigma-70 family RNA polymerase sigma factor [Acidobacteriota bacterium]
MTTVIGTMLLNVIEFVTAWQAEPKTLNCPQSRAIEHLLWRVGRGDRSALPALYDQTSSLAYGLALRITGDRAAAEEITVAVYEEAWQNAPSIAGGVCFLNWLAESTRTLALERCQRVSDRHSPPAVLPAEIPASQDEEGTSALPQEWTARRQRARAALAALAPEERAVVELAYFSGLKISEIARQLALPEDRVKSLQRSGVLTFRFVLNQGLPSPKQ